MNGKAKEQWGKMTDDDLIVVTAQREKHEGHFQQRYYEARHRAAQHDEKFSQE